MKTLNYALGCALAIFCSCGADQSPENASPEKGVTKAGTQPEEQRQQADILTKDTMNAVQEETVRKPTLGTAPDFKPIFEKFRQTIAQEDA